MKDTKNLFHTPAEAHALSVADAAVKLNDAIVSGHTSFTIPAFVAGSVLRLLRESGWTIHDAEMSAQGVTFSIIGHIHDSSTAVYPHELKGG